MNRGDDQDLHDTDQENGALFFDDMFAGYNYANNGFFSMAEDYDKVTNGAVNFNGFYNQEFPRLPDFPCMSSSSSCSSTQPPSKNPAFPSVSSSSASSSSTPWYVSRSDYEDTPAEAPTPTADECVDVMENFGYMDLLDVSDLWDPSSIFDENNDESKQRSKKKEEGEEEEERQLDEHGAMFLEWLKNNKEHISAQDMRSIKLKKSTIESASKRLGNSNEGKKQLLKLILEWVEKYQLQKNNNGETLPSQFPFLGNPNPNPCYPPPPSGIPPQFNSASGSSGFYTEESFSDIRNFQNYPPEYHHQMMDNSNNNDYSWPSSQFMMSYNQFPDGMNPSSDGFCGNQYQPQVFCENGTDRLLSSGSSATKEARKNRMEKQRRVNSSNHHSRHHHSSGGNGDGGSSNNNNYEQNDGSGGGGSVPVAAKRGVVQSEYYHRKAAADLLQGWKQEKNLMFLLQKVLKQSDVSSLGRIVLPKKEAETYLPALDSRDGIAISMEDIESSRVWNMRYRFWPNNRSRMYLLENTGEFVRENGLQEGDIIVIYSDIKCGKYLIRGVKAREPEPNPEGKNTATRNLQRSSISYESSSSPG